MYPQDETNKRVKLRDEIKDNIVQKNKEVLQKLNNFITVLHDVNSNIFDNYQNVDYSKLRNDLLFQTGQILHKRIISQLESIEILLCNGKYLECYSLIRSLFENCMMLIYLQTYQYETIRWLDWTQLNFTDRTQYRKMKLNEFKQYLREKGYTDIEKRIDGNNFQSFLMFKPYLVRKLAFEEHKEIAGSDYDKFYSILTSFTHASTSGVFENDKQNEELFESIIKTAIFLAHNITTFLIDNHQNLVDVPAIKFFENAYSKLNEMLHLS